MGNLTGHSAISFNLSDSNNKVHRLSDYTGNWLLLVFLRHLGWLPCRAHLSQLRENEEKLNTYNVKIVVITFASQDIALEYSKKTGISWPILIDESRELYQGYGMLSASFWDIWGPKTWWAYFKEIVQGHKPKKTTGDIYQRGGDVLIDPDGIVRLHYVGDGPVNRPSLDTIFQILES